MGLCCFPGGKSPQEVVLAALRSLRKLSPSVNLMQKSLGSLGRFSFEYFSARICHLFVTCAIKIQRAHAQSRIGRLANLANTGLALIVVVALSLLSWYQGQAPSRDVVASSPPYA